MNFSVFYCILGLNKNAAGNHPFSHTILRHDFEHILVPFWDPKITSNGAFCITRCFLANPWPPREPKSTVFGPPNASKIESGSQKSTPRDFKSASWSLLGALESLLGTPGIALDCHWGTGGGLWAAFVCSEGQRHRPQGLGNIELGSL